MTIRDNPRLRKRLSALFVAACLALFGWREVMAMRADGQTVDEPFHLAYGELALAHGTFLRPSDAFNSKMPVSVLNAAAVGAARRMGGGSLSDERELFIGRLPTLLLGGLLAWLVFCWARALFGFTSGVLALLLFTFCPNILAYSHLITTDVATALGIFGATYAFWRYQEAPSRWRLLAAAAAFGAAQLAKATAFFLVPIFALIWLWRAWRQRWRPAARQGGEPRPAVDGSGAAEKQGAEGVAARGATVAAEGRGVAAERLSRDAAADLGAGFGRELLRGAGLLGVLGCGALVVLNLAFLGEGTFTPLARYPFLSRPFKAVAAVPLLRTVPLPLPYGYVQGLDMVAADTQDPYWSYLHGHFSDTGHWAYFLTAFALKVPLATQILFAAAIGLALSRRMVAARGGEPFLVIPVVLLLAYFSLGFPLQIGIRYILPVFPFVFVFLSRVAAAPVLQSSASTASLQSVQSLRSWRWRLSRSSRSSRSLPSSPSSWSWRSLRTPAALVAGALLLGWNAVASFLYHPHYLVYFNELAGGPDHGYRWLIDSNIDWGQDDDYVRDVYAARSPVPVLVEPSGPVAGRIAFGVSSLVGRDPHAAELHAWLRDHFRPIASIRHSWLIYDVGEAELARCCADLPQSWPVPDVERDLALGGFAEGGGDGVTVRLLQRLNDGTIGVNDEADAARTTPPQRQPVQAWFGVGWRQPKRIGRVVAFPGYLSRGPLARKYLALDYVFQFWDGGQWLDIPGTRIAGNRKLRLDHRFPPVLTTRIRLLIERERNAAGRLDDTATYRAACLELAAYPP